MVEVNIPTVKNFLYFFSLRDGVKILGWVFLVGHFCAMFEAPLRNLRVYLECDLIPIWEDEDTGSHVCPDWLKLKLLVTVVADFGLSIAQILTAFVLLMGVYQTKPRLILQWIVLQLVMIILDVIIMESSYLRDDIKQTMTYFYVFYATWKSVELYGVYICYSYYVSVTSDPAQVV